MAKSIVIKNPDELVPPVFWTEENSKIFELYSEGFDIKEIAEKVGVPKKEITSLLVHPVFIKRYSELTDGLHSTIVKRVEEFMLQGMEELWSQIKSEEIEMKPSERWKRFLDLLTLAVQNKVKICRLSFNMAKFEKSSDEDLEKEFSIHANRITKDSSMDQTEQNSDEQRPES